MEVYNRYYKAMYNTAHRIVKDSFEAEDIMQDSFLTAFTKLESLKDAEYDVFIDKLENTVCCRPEPYPGPDLSRCA